MTGRRAPVTITRQKAPPVIMLSKEDFDPMRETIYLLSPARGGRRCGRRALRAAAGPSAERVDALIVDIQRRPHSGLGRPEPLRGHLAGWWSRRIDREHRLVYRVPGSNPRSLEIAQCRYHY